MHTITRLILLDAAVLFLAVSPALARASESGPPIPAAKAPVYLALGDSIPFGDNPLVHPPKNPNWFVGYPRYLADILDIRHVNAACPGETSGSFIRADAEDNGCRDFRSSHELHTEYAGTQLAFALEFLRTHERVELVTVALGANDLLLLLAACGGNLECAAVGAPAVIEGAARNMATVLFALRSTGYRDQILVPLYYSPSDNPIMVAAIVGLNQALTQVASIFGAQVANVFDAFERQSTGAGGDACTAGLLIPLPEGGCDKHPAQGGAWLIAEEIAALVPVRERD